MSSSNTRKVRQTSSYGALDHYDFNTGPTEEFGDLPETLSSIKNIGWTLGNDCPYRCHHCYSMSARRKGQNMSLSMIDRIISQLSLNGVKTVNLGGNEPLFTNGPNPKNTLLPYIISQLVNSDIKVGLTTSGITLLYLFEHHRDAFDLLNDVDISFDSPYENEHNQNRGAKLYHQAIRSLEICQEYNKSHTCIMAGMNWNFSIDHLSQMVILAKQYGANIRINPIKPVEPKHLQIALSPDMYYAGFAFLMEVCQSIDLGEPPIAAVTNYQHAKRCPCGRTSFRIHSITPDGGVYISPCVYLHDYKSPLNLLEFDLVEIINSPQFRVFRQRNANPEIIEGCNQCSLLAQCGGGCAARSYLHHVHETGTRSMLARDPYCPIRVNPSFPFPQNPLLDNHETLVHMDYLCTWIGKPK
ncbi:MAG: radical SAM protein [bacterium]